MNPLPAFLRKHTHTPLYTLWCKYFMVTFSSPNPSSVPPCAETFCVKASSPTLHWAVSVSWGSEHSPKNSDPARLFELHSLSSSLTQFIPPRCKLMETADIYQNCSLAEGMVTWRQGEIQPEICSLISEDIIYSLAIFLFLVRITPASSFSLEACLKNSWYCQSGIHG